MPTEKSKLERDLRWVLRLTFRFWLALFLVLSFYTLSIGPMFWYWYEAKYLSGSPLIVKFYNPLLKLCEKSDTLTYWINQYIEWWNY